MSNNCDGCDYNVDDYCIMFDDYGIARGFRKNSAKNKGGMVK